MGSNDGTFKRITSVLEEGDFSMVRCVAVVTDEGLTTFLPRLQDFFMLTGLTIYKCERLTSLPTYFNKLVNLERFYIKYCPELHTFSVDGLVGLTNLGIQSCNNLETLPTNLGELYNLQFLFVFSCEGLTTLPTSIERLSNLRKLHISTCEKLTILPDCIGILPHIDVLAIFNCNTLVSLPTNLGRKNGPRVYGDFYKWYLERIVYWQHQYWSTQQHHLTDIITQAQVWSILLSANAPPQHLPTLPSEVWEIILEHTLPWSPDSHVSTITILSSSE